jgi:hypothetical protein
MEHPSHRLGAPLLADSVPDAFVVLDKSFPLMMRGVMRRIVAVIAKVINDHVVAIEQRSPERKVAIDGERVAMITAPSSMTVSKAACGGGIFTCLDSAIAKLF